MKPAATPYRHRATWSIFAALLLLAVVFITGTVSELPLTVASHFDAAGRANAFMSRSGYTWFVLCLAVGLPLVIVSILTAVYSRASSLKLPNVDYWLAAQRIDRTRAFLAAHGAWFGSMLVVLACLVHWLELAANRESPPHLPNQLFAAVMIAFLVATAAWIATLMVAFRRPSRE
jgi:uncharacterized membrane protein